MFHFYKRILPELYENEMTHSSFEVYGEAIIPRLGMYKLIELFLKNEIFQ